MDLSKGIVCSKTGERAAFEEQCPDFSGSEVPPPPPVADEPSEISGFLSFYLFWSIPIGLVLTIIMTIVNFDASLYQGGVFLLLADVLLTALYVYLCIYVIYAFVKRQPDAVFMAKYELIYLFLSNVLVVVLGETTTYTYTSMAWAVVFFCYVAFSEQVKDLIPKETRRLTKLNRYVVPISIVVPLLCFALGLVETVRGYGFFSSAEEKLEQICEQTQALLPQDNFHSMYLDGETVVYGYDISLGELTQPTKERIGITLREEILANLDMTDPDLREFFSLCVEADYDVVYKYLDRSTWETVEAVIFAEQLSQILAPDYVHSVSAESWGDVLDLYNAECPQLYLEDCYVDNVSVDLDGKIIRYDLRLFDVQASALSLLTDDYLKAHMLSQFEYVADDVMNLAGLSGFDVEYNFSIDSLPWWTKSVHLEHNELF